MIVKTVWNEVIHVRTYETDFQSHWKPSCYFQAMQEAASNHAQHLGVGYKALLERDIAWVLSRCKIYFYESPIIGEQVTIQTWPKGIQQKIFFMRDFIITGEKGQKLALATSAWLLVNVSKRRMLMPDVISSEMPQNTRLSAIDEKLDKIATPEEMQELFNVRARYGTVDVNGHVNNTRYIEWISDCLPFETYRSRSLDWMQINYNNEIRPNELVSISAAKDENDPSLLLIEGANRDSKLKAFQAALKLSD